MTEIIYKMGIAAALAGAITALVTPLVKKLAIKAGVVRAPRERDMHQEPIPLWGGVAILIGFFVAFLAIRPFLGVEIAIPLHKVKAIIPLLGHRPILGIVLGGAFVAGIGLLDDKGDLSPRYQTLGIMAGGLFAALLGARIAGITNPFSKEWVEFPLSLSVFFTVCWVFLATKTFDFLDGLDGLAAGIAAIVGTTMGLIAAVQGDMTVALIAAVLVGSSVGFLRHNYNPASIFMGTVGAQFLGFVLAELAVLGAFKVSATLSLIIPLVAFGVPVGDGLYVVGRRFANKRPLTEAARDHIHHRLRDKGLETKQAVLAIYGLTAVTCLLALLLAWVWGR
jgi:UDP-GlcNAc:undecaprenyl-phosphate/decaprenyl-phosphate GlcNAc-1-phosphate transferase